MKINTYNPIQEAISVCGSQVKLAKLCGVAQPTIFKWLKKGFVPPRKVLIVEKITGIPRYKLNPDIYPRYE